MGYYTPIALLQLKNRAIKEGQPDLASAFTLMRDEYLKEQRSIKDQYLADYSAAQNGTYSNPMDKYRAVMSAFRKYSDANKAFTAKYQDLSSSISAARGMPIGPESVTLIRDFMLNRFGSEEAVPQEIKRVLLNYDPNFFGGPKTPQQTQQQDGYGFQRGIGSTGFLSSGGTGFLNTGIGGSSGSFLDTGIGGSSGSFLDTGIGGSSGSFLDTGIGGTSQPVLDTGIGGSSQPVLDTGTGTITTPPEESLPNEPVLDVGGPDTQAPDTQQPTNPITDNPLIDDQQQTDGGGTSGVGGLPTTGPEDSLPEDDTIDQGEDYTMANALPTAPVPGQQFDPNSDINRISEQMVYQPGVPAGSAVQVAGVGLEAGQLVDPNVGQVQGAVNVPTSFAATTTAQMPQAQEADITQAQEITPFVNQATAGMQAAQGVVGQQAQMEAAQQMRTGVTGLQAAQGEAILMDNPVQREIQQGELIDGVADAQKASQFIEQIQAAEATPSEQATVQGQLAQLTANFDMTNPPSWAAGAMRAVNEQLAARGLSASSMAGQALVQGALESALPIAMADAQTFATFEMQNLSNRQQRAMFAAQQRAAFLGQEFDQAFQSRVANAAKIADVANMNFTAEQQIALENSRTANTVNLQNLSNRQAKVLAEAAAISQLEGQNLNNRQQAAVQNAQNFMQMDLTNLSNRQQTEMFRQQSIVQSLFSDQAAINASRQFNATSRNQLKTFFAELGNTTSQFNAAQSNAQSQFNAGQANVVQRFNAEINDARDRFNAQNRLIIDQSNAQWRRSIATADTTAINRANEINAMNVLGISNTAYNNLWQQYSDNIEFAWRSAENELDRYNRLAEAQLSSDTQKEVQNIQAESNAGSAIGGLIGTLGGALISRIFP